VQDITLKSHQATSNAHEEALRMGGEVLGYSASLGRGTASIQIASRQMTTPSRRRIRIKNKECRLSQLSQTEIGQAHNHVQSRKDEYAEYTVGGRLIHGLAGI
jgi:hypothetical protein